MIEIYREMVNVIEHNVKEAADFSGQGLKMLETAEHTVVVRRKVSEWLLISLDAIKSS
jgi:hypothetical protein